MKKCSGCNKTFLLDNFHKDSSKKSGYHSYCKICRAVKGRVQKMQRRYGMSVEEYEFLLVSQNSVCYICKNPETRKNAINLSVDHDHESGRVRGLLCNDCNVGISRFKDSPELLVEAAQYLKDFASRG